MKKFKKLASTLIALAMFSSIAVSAESFLPDFGSPDHGIVEGEQSSTADITGTIVGVDKPDSSTFINVMAPILGYFTYTGEYTYSETDGIVVKENDLNLDASQNMHVVNLSDKAPLDVSVKLNHLTETEGNHPRNVRLVKDVVSADATNEIGLTLAGQKIWNYGETVMDDVKIASLAPKNDVNEDYYKNIKLEVFAHPKKLPSTTDVMPTSVIKFNFTFSLPATAPVQ